MKRSLHFSIEFIIPMVRIVDTSSFLCCGHSSGGVYLDDGGYKQLKSGDESKCVKNINTKKEGKTPKLLYHY